MSRNHADDNQRKNTSSGHGALGMGGQPDDPRDLESGAEDRWEDERTGRTGRTGDGQGNRKQVGPEKKE